MKKIKLLLMAAFTIVCITVFANENTALKNLQNQTEQTKYSCPMHADVISDKPGKCTKCGMALKAQTKPAKTFICPMHADVTSDKPGKCTKCGMALVEKKAPHKEHNN